MLASQLRRTNNFNRSVRFGEAVDQGLGENQVFPFWYNFINREDDSYIDGTSGILASLGPTIASGAQAVQIVKLQADYPYKLISIRYNAYYNNAGTVEWYNNEAGFFLEQGDYQSSIGTPLHRYIAVSVIAKGSDGRYLYGGTNLNMAVTGGGPELRIPPSCIQGYDNGPGFLNTEYLLPADGAIELRISNNHPSKTLVVTGETFGYKVRI